MLSLRAAVTAGQNSNIVTARLEGFYNIAAADLVAANHMRRIEIRHNQYSHRNFLLATLTHKRSDRGAVRREPTYASIRSDNKRAKESPSISGTCKRGSR